jgi:hypothetical protein
VRRGEGITNRPAEQVIEEEQDHPGGKTGEKAAWQGMRECREIEAMDVETDSQASCCR